MGRKLQQEGQLQQQEDAAYDGHGGRQPKAKCPFHMLRGAGLL